MSKAKLWFRVFASSYAQHLDAGTPWFASVRFAMRSASRTVRRLRDR